MTMSELILTHEQLIKNITHENPKTPLKSNQPNIIRKKMHSDEMNEIECDIHIKVDEIG